MATYEKGYAAGCRSEAVKLHKPFGAQKILSQVPDARHAVLVEFSVFPVWFWFYFGS